MTFFNIFFHFNPSVQKFEHLTQQKLSVVALSTFQQRFWYIICQCSLKTDWERLGAILFKFWGFSAFFDFQGTRLCWRVLKIMKITFLIIKQSIFKIFWWFKMHWVQCTELHKLIYLKSIKTINKYIKNWYHCWFQNFSNAQVADFKPPKNRLPVGILKFRKNVLVQKVLGYSKLKQSGIVLYFHYLIHLIPGPGLKGTLYFCLQGT